MAFQWWARLVLQTQTLIEGRKKWGERDSPGGGTGRGARCGPGHGRSCCGAPPRRPMRTMKLVGSLGISSFLSRIAGGIADAPRFPPLPRTPPPSPRPAQASTTLLPAAAIGSACVCKLAAHRFSLDDVRGAFSPRWSRAEIGSQADGFPPW